MHLFVRLILYNIYEHTFVRGGYMNRTEVYIRRFYHSINIYSPYQLDIRNISEKANLSIIHWPYTSEITYYNGTYKIFINENLTKQQQWQDFGHEIGHFLLHDGNQTNMHHLFFNYQECQAEYFSYHFCVPTFMLLELKKVTIYDVMNLFNVEYNFAYTRLEMYRNKFIERIAENERTYS